MKQLFACALLLVSSLHAMEVNRAEGTEKAPVVQKQKRALMPGVGFIVENKTKQRFDLCERTHDGIMLQEKCLWSVKPDETIVFFIGGVIGAIALKNNGKSYATLIYHYSQKNKIFDVTLQNQGKLTEEDQLIAEGDIKKDRYYVRVILQGDDLLQSSISIEGAH